MSGISSRKVQRETPEQAASTAKSADIKMIAFIMGELKAEYILA